MQELSRSKKSLHPDIQIWQHFNQGVDPSQKRQVWCTTAVIKRDTRAKANRGHCRNEKTEKSKTERPNTEQECGRKKRNLTPMNQKEEEGEHKEQSKRSWQNKIKIKNKK